MVATESQTNFTWSITISIEPITNLESYLWLKGNNESEMSHIDSKVRWWVIHITSDKLKGDAGIHGPPIWVRMLKRGCKDPRTADLIRISSGNVGIHGQPNRSKSYKQERRDPRTAHSVRVTKGGCRDPRTIESVRMLQRGCKDPRKADLVRIFRGNVGIHGQPNRSKFYKRERRDLRNADLVRIFNEGGRDPWTTESVQIL